MAFGHRDSSLLIQRYWHSGETTTSHVIPVSNRGYSIPFVCGSQLQSVVAISSHLDTAVRSVACYYRICRIRLHFRLSAAVLWIKRFMWNDKRPGKRGRLPSSAARAASRVCRVGRLLKGARLRGMVQAGGRETVCNRWATRSHGECDARTLAACLLARCGCYRTKVGVIGCVTVIRV